MSDEEKPASVEKPPVDNAADDPELRPEKKPISEIKPEPRPEERPEPEPAPKEPILELEGEAETSKHKIEIKKPHKCPHCGELTEPCTIKTNEGVINARACKPCGKAYT